MTGKIDTWLPSGFAKLDDYKTKIDNSKTKEYNDSNGNTVVDFSDCNGNVLCQKIIKKNNSVEYRYQEPVVVTDANGKSIRNTNVSLFDYDDDHNIDETNSGHIKNVSTKDNGFFDEMYIGDKLVIKRTKILGITFEKNV